MNTVETKLDIQEEVLTERPNKEIENYFKFFEDIIEICNNADDYVNMHYLNFNLYRKKFDSNDLKFFNELRNKYLLH
jgi:hypothetical protein